MMEDLLSLLKEHEGFASRPYRCPTGYLTIGFGHNLDSTPISRTAAEVILFEDASRAVEDAMIFDPSFNFRTPNRKIVLASMAFVLGLRGLMKFQKLRKALEDKDYDKAADEMLNSLWYSQASSRVKYLADMMRKG